MPDAHRQSIRAFRVRQWLSNWETFQYAPSAFRRKPKAHFYLFKMNARDLKALSGIQRRQVRTGEERSHEIGIQRRHEKTRSEEISRFVLNGYPWSGFAKNARESEDFDDLRKPGWLPTAVVVNILEAKNTRRGQKIYPQDCITIESGADDLSEIILPSAFKGASYKPYELYPIEVIDGQHRLWAFDEGTTDEEFELPVVAFHGLDLSWQAYLFYTINIKPKRINPSLAYDLYPLLRTEDWLDKFEGKIYRETRAQELTEFLWLHPQSPWHNRINMLGDPTDRSGVSQAAWIRALLATYVKASEGKKGAGGLFGAPIGRHRTTLSWSRSQQAAFLIYLWQQIEVRVRESDYEWAASLRTNSANKRSDAAFLGQFTLLNQDQGVRGVLFATNDLCFAASDDLQLDEWSGEDTDAAPDQDKISHALLSLKSQPVAQFLQDVSAALAKYDWRSASFPGLTEDERLSKMAFRGSGGYTELKKQLLKLLVVQPGTVGKVAARLTVGP